MKLKTAILCAVSTTSLAGCGKGGGGGWLVGSDGLMVNISPTGELGDGYNTGATEKLNGIACRYLDEAWVVGDRGTLLYTADAGASWKAQNLGTTADLRSLATQDDGPVFVVGNGVFFTAQPHYGDGSADWTQVSDGSANFRSIAAAQEGTTVLAVSDDGGMWSYANNTLTRTTTLTGMRAVAVTPDGRSAFAVGDGIYQSQDRGATWQPVAVDPSFAYQAVTIDDTGTAVAVGDNGLVSRIDNEGRVLSQHVGDATLLAIHITESDDYSGVGYASGVGGQVWLTDDAGWTWTKGPNVGRTVLGADQIGFGHN